jgi:hypothetical protein
MGNGKTLGDALGVVDVLARTAGALLLHGLAVIVELQRDAHDVVALARQQRGDDRGVHAARHRRDHARGRRRLGETQGIPGGIGKRRGRVHGRAI